MAEEVTTLNGVPLPSQRARQGFVVTTLIFCWSIVLFVVFYGDPANSLHSSALAWAFGTSAAVLFAYVFGVVADNWSFTRAFAQPTTRQVQQKELLNEAK